MQALGGGFSTVICMASVRDIYPVIELGKRFATVTMIVLVAPLVAPTLGSLLLPLGWQSIFLFKAAYALVLVVLYAMIVPETQAGAWRDISVAAIFRQCAGVLGRRVDGSLLPLRYAFAMALASSVLMNFVTNASFVYLEYFDVSPSRFPWFFGLSVLGFMSMNLYSMRRLRPENAGTLFPRGLVIQFLGVSGLAAVVLADAASLWTIVPLIVVTMSTLGLIAPAGSAQYMGFFTRLAGSASSVYTTMMFTMGGALGALTGALYDGSLLPMVAVMGAASVTANIVVLTMPRQPAEQPV